MADEPKEEAAKAIKDSAPGGMKKLLAMSGIGLAVMIGSAVGGALASKFLSGSPQEASAAASSEKSEKGEKSEKADKHSEPAATSHEGGMEYYDFEPITVNLDDARLNRYVRATVVLAIRKDDFKAAKEQIEKRKPELKSWMTVYLASCTIEDVRGPRNLNRIRREIEESLNDHLWKDSKPLIDHALFKEFFVQ